MTMKLTLRNLLLLGMLASLQPASSAMAEDVYEWTGIYAKLGMSVGFPMPDSSGADVGAGAGFDLLEGIRVNSWFAGEIGFNFIAGADVAGDNDNLSVFSATVDAKFYPLGLWQVDAIPSWFQPYGLVGIGGGQVKLDSNSKEGSFMVHYGGGLDLFLWNNLGLYLNGGYLQITDKKTALKGSGQVMFGILYRL